MEQGVFSTSLLALHHQLKGLLDGVGGESTSKLLDLLATLSDTERQEVLRLFISVAEQVADGEERFWSSDEDSEKATVDALTNDIISALRQRGFKERGFKDLGGKELRAVASSEIVTSKEKKAGEPVDLDAFRRRKGMAPLRPFLN